MNFYGTAHSTIHTTPWTSRHPRYNTTSTTMILKLHGVGTGWSGRSVSSFTLFSGSGHEV